MSRRDPHPAVNIADCERDLCVRAGERPGAASTADPGRRAGDDRALAGQVDGGDDLGSGRLGTRMECRDSTSAQFV